MTREGPRPNAARVGVRARARGAGLITWAIANWAFVLVLGVAVTLRAVAVAAYAPSIPLRNNDSYNYLARAITMSPEGSFHPFAYSAMLKPFLVLDAVRWVVVVQHAAGVATGVLLYAFLRRVAVPRWLATLGSAPVLLDGYQIALEHQFFGETFFELFTVAGVVMLAWNAAPRWPAAAAVGLLLGMSVLVRFAGLAVIAAAVVYALVRRIGWIPLAALVVSILIPLVGYATWFERTTGTFGLTNRNGFYLYGRVAAFADCDGIAVPPAERLFCPENLDHPPGRGLFASGLPKEIRRNPRYNEPASSFARRMIRTKPAEYVGAVLTDFTLYFRSRESQDHGKWRFPLRLKPRDERRVPPGITIDFQLDRRRASLVRSWQDSVSLYGPLLGVLLTLAVVGGVVGWGARERSRTGPEAWLLALAALGLMLFPTVFAVYHFRYSVPVLPFAGAAGAAGAWAIWMRIGELRRRRGAAERRARA